MKGQLNARLPGLRATRRLSTGDGLPPLPSGFIFLVDRDGAFLTDADGAFLVEPV